MLKVSCRVQCATEYLAEVRLQDAEFRLERMTKDVAYRYANRFLPELELQMKD